MRVWAEQSPFDLKDELKWRDLPADLGRLIGFVDVGVPGPRPPVGPVAPPVSPLLTMWRMVGSVVLTGRSVNRASNGRRIKQRESLVRYFGVLTK
jgi:hypothetical protein